LPALARAREQTREVLCRSHLRQLATGFHTYATEFNGCLPGTDRDNILIGGTVAKGFCWLGTGPDTWNSYQDAIKYVPFRGTVYKYVSQDPNVYKCPTDKLRKTTFGGTEKTLYSYTTPLLLDGAALQRLKSTVFPGRVEANQWSGADGEWKTWGVRSVPWMIVEEDEEIFLTICRDSAWCNVDAISARHAGKGSVAHTDGSVSQRAYPRVRQLITRNEADGGEHRYMYAWKVWFERSDGRYIRAGTMAEDDGSGIHFGYLSRARGEAYP
jgi:hypothetical protein